MNLILLVLLTKVAQVRPTQLTAGLKPAICMAIYRTRIADMCSFGDEVQSFVKNRRAKARIVCVCVRERERERCSSVIVQVGHSSWFQTVWSGGGDRRGDTIKLFIVAWRKGVAD